MAVALSERLLVETVVSASKTPVGVVPRDLHPYRIAVAVPWSMTIAAWTPRPSRPIVLGA
jgi:hypothetical protein